MARPRTSDLPAPGPRLLAFLAAGTALFAGGAYLARTLLREGARRARGAEHAAPDLALDRPRPGAEDRAPEAFRPDPTAAVPDSEREALRPATGPAPTLVAGPSQDR